MKALLRRPDREEAAAWLTRGQGSHYIGECEAHESVHLVRSLHTMGAVRIEVVDIGENGGLASTDHVIISLPEDRSSRKLIFDWNNDRVAKMGLDGDEDVGQKHLLAWFD